MLSQVLPYLVALVLGAPTPAPAPFLTVSETGEIIVSDGLERLASMQFGIHATDWGTGYTQQDRVRGAKLRFDGSSRIVEGSLEVPGSSGRRLLFIQEVTPVGDQEFRITYRFHFPQEVSICSYHLKMEFPVAPLVGKPIVSSGAEQRRLTIGPKPEQPILIIAPAGALEVASEDPNGFVWSCGNEMSFLLQDNRAWGGDVLEARFLLKDDEQPSPVAADTTVVRTFTLRYNKPVRAALDIESPDAVDTKGWRPYAPSVERAPVDVSFLNEKPAGGHGMVRARDAALAFADGAPARFWGMHLDGVACLPDHDDAERAARHLASLGANLVRMRRVLPLLAEPGADAPDAQRLERLDYLVAALKREGIYTLLDVPTGGKWTPSASLLSVIWSHTNPHTRLRWSADSAIAAVQVLIERSAFGDPVEPMSPQEALDSDRKLYETTAASLRTAGVRAPILASAWGESIAQTAALQNADVIAGHGYWDQPHGRLEAEIATPLSMQPAGYLPITYVATRCAGKPFVGFSARSPWCMEWRAEALLSLAASGALQGWDGCVSHIYRANSGPQASALMPHQSSNDPAVVALAPHAALLFRRADADAGRKLVTIAAGGKATLERAGQGPWEMPAFLGSGETRRVQVTFADPPPPGSISLDDRSRVEGSAEFISDTGQLIRSPSARIGTVNTPRTQAVYGLVGGAVHELSDVSLTVRTRYAALALSSLTDEPIRDSRCLLLTAVGRAENTGAAYNVLHTQRTRPGVAPILVEPIEATVAIRCAAKLPVRPVRRDGTAGPELPTTYSGGRLTFAIGADESVVHYRIGE